MDNTKVTAILWMLVGVTIVCLFAAKVSIYSEQLKWSRVETPKAKTTCTVSRVGCR